MYHNYLDILISEKMANAVVGNRDWSSGDNEGMASTYLEVMLEITRTAILI